MPLLSVLMPCKNLNESCRKSIESILSQKVDLELIIVIDGGENNLKLNDPRIIIKKLDKNLGPAAAANKCYKYASGEYITVHDDDDFSEPNRYSILLDEIKENRAITSNINIIENNLSYIKYYSPSNIIYPHKIKPPAHHCATIIRKDLWDELGNYDERFISADSLRMIKLGVYLLLKNEKFVLCEKPLYNYIIRDGSVSRTKRWEKEIRQVRKFILRIYQKNKDPIEFLNNSNVEGIEILSKKPSKKIRKPWKIGKGRKLK